MAVGLLRSWWTRGLLGGVVVGLPWLSGMSRSDVPASRDFAEYLLGRDLVVEATFLGADTLRRQLLGGCGAGPSEPMESLDLRLRVTRVIFGTAEDTTIVVSTLGHVQFPATSATPGAHVIAWAGRECTDGWRLWGSMVVVTPTGLLVGDPNHADGLFLHGQPGGYPVRYEALEASLTAQAGKHSANYFSGKEAVALVRVRQIQQVTRGFFTYECDSIGWVVGFGAQVPRFVDVNAGMLGCDWARAGDSLLVPVHEDQALDRVTLPGCSGALLVKRGYLPGLGVPLVFLSYALRMGPNGLEVRPFVGEE